MNILIKDAKRKVFLVLDNLKAHLAKLVRAWIEKHQEEIEVFYLPSYSPELNQDEYLNADFKAGIRTAALAMKKKDLKGTVLGPMRMLLKKPQ